MPSVSVLASRRRPTRSAHAAGPSSNEDLWMFMTFAMLVLVFVLFHYVKYLAAVVVKPELQPPAVATVAEAQPKIDLFVLPGGVDGSARYKVGELGVPIPAAELTANLRRAMPSAARAGLLDVYVHAPGERFYQEVFEAAHAAEAVAGADPDLDRAAIHLVYDAEE